MVRVCLSVGETCGLPRANTVRPYRVLYNFSAKNISFLGEFFMPILCYTTKNRRRKRARGSPLDPVAALALNASKVFKAIPLFKKVIVLDFKSIN